MPARAPSVSRPGHRRRALVHGLTASGLLFLLYLFLVTAPQVKTFGYDAWAYWSVQLPHPYTVSLGGLGSFLYSPAIALVFNLFGALPWWVFLWLWVAAMLGTIIWLGGRWTLVALAFPPVALELYHGNIHLFLAAAVALGFAHPWSWSFVLLTKATSGVGLLWFVVRREWRELAVAVGVTAAIAGATFLIAPGLWTEWISFIGAEVQGTPGGSSVPVPLWLRLIAAAAIVTWGARTDRRWTVAVAATVALPVLWLAGFSVLLAALPDLRTRAAHARSATRALPAGATLHGDTGAPTNPQPLPSARCRTIRSPR
jgi:Glycosyltransferase family 87